MPVHSLEKRELVCQSSTRRLAHHSSESSCHALKSPRGRCTNGLAELSSSHLPLRTFRVLQRLRCMGLVAEDFSNTRSAYCRIDSARAGPSSETKQGGSFFTTDLINQEQEPA